MHRVHIILPEATSLMKPELLPLVRAELVAAARRIAEHGIDIVIHENESDFEQAKNPEFLREASAYGERPAAARPEIFQASGLIPAGNGWKS